jgi:archaemetzincin
MQIKNSKAVSLAGILILFLFTGCNRQNGLSMYGKRQQVIAIQPFNNFEDSLADIISKQVAMFYKKKVVVLPRGFLPNTYINPAIHQYSADSILLSLSKFKNDSIVEIIGFTNYPVYTLKGKAENFETNLFGASHQPGNEAIISVAGFNSAAGEIFIQRLMNVIIHEVGHNMGLGHCSTQTCAMSEYNGKIEILDKGKKDYCTRCKKLLQ